MLVFILSSICIFAALALLIILSVIDLRTRLLPNIYVFPFAVLGVVFHLLNDFQLLSIEHVLIGGAAGYGFLYTLRAGANAYYGQDSLGLGDVKLLGAAGLWLGLEGVLIAMTAGAFFGLLHGIVYGFWIAFKNKEKPNFHRLAIPAGPGFAAGIVVSAPWVFGGIQ